MTAAAAVYNERYAQFVRFVACVRPVTEADLIRAHAVAADTSEPTLAPEEERTDSRGVLDPAPYEERCGFVVGSEYYPDENQHMPEYCDARVAAHAEGFCLTHFHEVNGD